MKLFSLLPVLVILVHPTLGAGVQYTVMALPANGAAAANAVAITNSEMILTGDGIWQQGVPFQPLQPLAGGNSGGQAINATGTVVGRTYYPEDSQATTATMWQSGEPSVLLPLSGDDAAMPSSINDAGQIVGSSAGASGLRAVLWQNGAVQDLSPLLPGAGEQSVAVAVNNSGQIVVNKPNSAFVIAAGAATPITGPAGTYSVMANAINDKGQVGGVAYTDSGQGHAFIWTAGSMNIAPSLTNILPFDNEVTSINNDGMAVGFYLVQGVGERAFVWDGGSAPADLNDLIDPASGWVLQIAWGINDAGDIVGLGTQNGVREAFLLTPIASGSSTVPEPATVSVLFLGGIILLSRRNWWLS